ncbi:hypothetical protein Lal_00040897 [Lupinus albus]|nr:hypothetical protein Lal_00040897 [Lupinus albus]
MAILIISVHFSPLFYSPHPSLYFYLLPFYNYINITGLGCEIYGSNFVFKSWSYFSTAFLNFLCILIPRSSRKLWENMATQAWLLLRLLQMQNAGEEGKESLYPNSTLLFSVRKLADAASLSHKRLQKGNRGNFEHHTKSIQCPMKQLCQF